MMSMLLFMSLINPRLLSLKLGPLSYQAYLDLELNEKTNEPHLSYSSAPCSFIFVLASHSDAAL